MRSTRWLFLLVLAALGGCHPNDSPFPARQNPLSYEAAAIVPNPHSIEGYANAVSVLPGSTIELKVHAPNNQINIDFSRYGSLDPSPTR